jgi:hypothetical protein
MEDNLFSLKDLEGNLRYYGKRIENTPLIIQYNKRDLPNILPLEELNQKINLLNVPYFESVATVGKGVFETLTMACRLVLKAIEEGVEARKSVGKPEITQEKLPPLTPAVEKDVSRLEAPRDGQGLTQARALRPEKSISPAEAVSLMAESAFAKNIKSEKDIFSPGQITVIPDRAPKVCPIPGKEIFPSEVAGQENVPGMVLPKTEEERKKPSGRTLFSRMFEKIKPEPVLKSEEEPQKIIPATPEKMRIISCGQPRVFPPSSLKIPLTIEMEGLRKSFSINLVINLE